MITTAELDEIEKRCKEAVSDREAGIYAASDVPRLITEVKRLSARVQYLSSATFSCHGCNGDHEQDCPVRLGNND